jgi:glycosyltransferase involved in cell wall biosynthesis
MPKILFIAAHRPNRSPSQRFRFEQYIPFLESNGFSCEISHIINEKDDKVLYEGRSFVRKLRLLIRAIFIRWKAIKKVKQSDIVFVQREALMIGSTWFERQVKRSKAKFVFDFDDSIWILDTSEVNKKWEWLKDTSKTKKLIAMADLVIAGNNYLANYALLYNKNVVTVPTTVDTEIFQPNFSKKNTESVCIGWSGSHTTIKHFKYILPVLKKLKQRYNSKINFLVIGDENFSDEELGIKGQPWKKDNEVELLNTIDIGLMPLPDDQWSEGKCGLKGLTYMALEIPTIMSPVGVNKEIIQHGKNGFLADSENEWFETLSQLIEKPELRKVIGQKGRNTVKEKYSVNANKNIYLDSLLKCLN